MTTITEIINADGDGNGKTLDNPNSIAVDNSGNVYVVGGATDPTPNAFKIATDGTITQIIDASGDGNGLYCVYVVFLYAFCMSFRELFLFLMQNVYNA